jgi:hypothetical protein
MSDDVLRQVLETLRRLESGLTSLLDGENARQDQISALSTALSAGQTHLETEHDKLRAHVIDRLTCLKDSIADMRSQHSAESPAKLADKPPIEQQEIYVSIWKTAVETQMHFNEMSVKARQFGLTFVAAALGLGVVLMSRNQEFSLSVSYLGGFEIHAIVVLILASAFALYAVRLLDLNVYHKMLRGAVTFGEDFEENYVKQIFDLEKGMTQAISHFSRHDDAHVCRTNRRYHYLGNSMRNAGTKVGLFYWISIASLVVLAIILFILTAHFGEHRKPVFEPAAHNATTSTSGPIAAPEDSRGGNAK